MPPQSNSNKIFLVVLVVSVLIILFNFSRAVNISHELSEVRSDTYDKKVMLDDYKNLEETSKDIDEALSNTFGGILYIKADGDNIPLTFKRASSNDKWGYRLLSQNLTDQTYGARLCSDLKIETGKFNQNNEAPIKVISGSKTGYNIIQLTSESKNESNHILVFVK